jgi:hypothetical protein
VRRATADRVIARAAALALVACVACTAGAVLTAMQARIGNAAAETRRVAGTIESELRGLGPGAVWIGYRVAMVPGERHMCCADPDRSGAFASAVGGAACRLNGGGIMMNTGRSDEIGDRVSIEPPEEFLLLARIDDGAAARLRTFTPDCEVDAEGARIVWFEGVTAAQSMEWLAALATSSADRRIGRTALTALAIHADSGAVLTLIRIAERHPDRETRKSAMVALARTSDPRAVSYFEGVLTGPRR